MLGFWTKRSAIALGFAAMLAACAEPPPPPEPTVAQVNVTGTGNLNPDPLGRASPTVVFIYALQPGAPFNIADYDALTGGELGKDADTMKRIARFVLVPGKSTKKIFELPDGTSEIGIAAAFRDVSTAKWRASAPVKPHTVTILEATLGANEVTLE